MKSLTLNEYREMVNSILDFKNENGKMPEYVQVNSKKIHHDEYYELMEQVNKFTLEMGRQPESIQYGKK
jgi:hypothetical protein